MAKKKQFAPHIYPEWGEIFEDLEPEQNSEILLAITKFPEYEPKNVPIWKFIKSQLQKDYEIFIEKCNKNENIIRNYWQKKKSNDYENIRTNTNEYECLPKRITNNELRITDNELQITNDEINETKIDYRYNPIINRVFDIYKEKCTNLVKLDRFYKRNDELKKLVGSYLEQTESNLEYFSRVCEIANKVIQIGSVKVDLKMILKNHDGFYNGKYKVDEQAEKPADDWFANQQEAY